MPLDLDEERDDRSSLTAAVAAVFRLFFHSRLDWINVQPSSSSTLELLLSPCDNTVLSSCGADGATENVDWRWFLSAVFAAGSGYTDIAVATTGATATTAPCFARTCVLDFFFSVFAFPRIVEVLFFPAMWSCSASATIVLPVRAVLDADTGFQVITDAHVLCLTMDGTAAVITGTDSMSDANVVFL